jgi:protein involved in polysaccharide export with SLBB domain
MQAGQGRCSWWAAGAVAPLLALLAGCAGGGPRLDRALLADRTPAAHHAGCADCYRVRCPDVLDVDVPGRPAWGGPHPVGPDGRIALGGDFALRVEGQTPPEVAGRVASLAGADPDRVRVHVAAYNSQQIYLFGEVSGPPRAVPYQGPETVLDLLQRAGGITPGAEVGNVHVVRAHVADGRPPEVFQVDLAAILQRHDQGTNVQLEPFDEVYVGQTRRSAVADCLPPWIRRVGGRAGGPGEGRPPEPARPSGKP